MVACSAFGCTNRSDEGTGLTFHKFPRDQPRKAKWIRAVARSNWSPTEVSKLCSIHFEKKLFIRKKNLVCLASNAVPTIFPSYPEYLKKIHKKVKLEDISGQVVRSKSTKKTEKTKSTDIYQSIPDATIQDTPGTVPPVVSNCVTPIVSNSFTPIVSHCSTLVNTKPCSKSNKSYELTNNSIQSMPNTAIQDMPCTAPSVVTNCFTPIVSNCVTPIMSNSVTPIVSNCSIPFNAKASSKSHDMTNNSIQFMPNTAIQDMPCTVPSVVPNCFVPVASNCITPIVSNCSTLVNSKSHTEIKLSGNNKKCVGPDHSSPVLPNVMPIMPQPNATPNVGMPVMVNFLVPSIPNAFMPALPNIVMPSIQNIVRQVVPNIVNQIIPNIANIVMPNIANQIMPNIGNQVMPNIANQVMLNNISQVMPNIVNQVVPNIANQHVSSNIVSQPKIGNLIQEIPSISSQFIADSSIVDMHDISKQEMLNRNVDTSTYIESNTNSPKSENEHCYEKAFKSAQEKIVKKNKKIKMLLSAESMYKKKLENLQKLYRNYLNNGKYPRRNAPKTLETRGPFVELFQIEVSNPEGSELENAQQSCEPSKIILDLSD